VWNGLVFQRQVDDAVLAGLQAEVATREAVVEFCADAVRDGADWLDDALRGEPAADQSGPLRRLAERPLDALVSANEAAGERLVDAADAGFDRYERGLRSVLLALNRRLNVLLAKHEALEARLREYVESLDEDEKAEQVADFRRQLSTLQTDLETMHARLASYEVGPAD
jgi:chromosome segregation ATPase